MCNVSPRLVTPFWTSDNNPFLAEYIYPYLHLCFFVLNEAETAKNLGS